MWHRERPKRKTESHPHSLSSVFSKMRRPSPGVTKIDFILFIAISCTSIDFSRLLCQGHGFCKIRRQFLGRFPFPFKLFMTCVHHPITLKVLSVHIGLQQLICFCTIRDNQYSSSVTLTIWTASKRNHFIRCLPVCL